MQFSLKDAEVWNFLFYYTDQVNFKIFEDAKPQDINGRKPYFQGNTFCSYRGVLSNKDHKQKYCGKKSRKLVTMHHTLSGLIDLSNFLGKNW